MLTTIFIIILAAIAVIGIGYAGLLYLASQADEG